MIYYEVISPKRNNDNFRSKLGRKSKWVLGWGDGLVGEDRIFISLVIFQHCRGKREYVSVIWENGHSLVLKHNSTSHSSHSRTEKNMKVTVWALEALDSKPSPMHCQQCVHWLDVLSMTVYSSGEWQKWQYILGWLVCGVNESRHIKGPFQNEFSISFGLYHYHSKKQLRQRRGEAFEQFQNLSLTTNTVLNKLSLQPEKREKRPVHASPWAHSRPAKWWAAGPGNTQVP